MHSRFNPMHSRFKTAFLLALLAAGALIALTATAQARQATPAADAATAGNGTCLVHSLPSFVDQGEFADTATVADVIEVECNPFVYGAGAEVSVTAAQLYDRCQKHLTWYLPDTARPTQTEGTADPALDGLATESGPTVNLRLDADGNATVALLGGPDCMVGESLITLDENEAPYETFTTAFQVLPPATTAPGVYALPPAQVEDATSSAVATIVQAELPESPEAKVRLASPQLYDRCRQGERLIWVSENGTVVADQPELAGEHAVQLDNDGNGFAILIGGDSCAEGTAQIEADLEESPFTTLITDFTVLPPQQTEEPSFTIEKLQEIAGSGKGFTTAELTGEVGQTVDYEIVVTNTANVSETFSDFSDPHCDPGTIADGAGALAPGQSTTYTCDHVLTAVGSYANEATVTGESVSGQPRTQTSNRVLVAVHKPEFTIEKLQRIKGSGIAYTVAPLIASPGQTAEYEIVVTNTGDVALTLSKVSDPNCAGTIMGGPEAPLQPAASTTYTCSRALPTPGSYTNEATVTATPPGEAPIAHTSNRVLVQVEEVTIGGGPAAFIVEKLQRIKGSATGYTVAPLSGEVGQTIEYEVVVTNTGGVPLKFPASAFSDADCDAGTIAGPGETLLEPKAKTDYTCTRAITASGAYTNVASVTGGAVGEKPFTEKTNMVEVSVPELVKSTGEEHKTTTAPAAGVSPASSTAAPKGGVLAACEVSGLVLRGATGPKRKSFQVSISANGIARVTFYLDGRKLKTLTSSQAKHGRFTIEINPRKLSYGAHRLSVKTVMSNSNCAPLARSSAFVRPRSARVAPKFTG